MNIQDVATTQLVDYDRHQPGLRFSEHAAAFTVEQAYELQLEVAQLRQKRGERVAGYKIGCVSSTMQTQMGLDRPVFGHVYDTELYHSGVTLDPDRYAGLAIEGEIAVRLAEDVPGVEWLRSRRRSIIAAAFAVIELHNYVFRRSPHTAQELIGNNALHTGVVLPLEETPIQDVDERIDRPLEVWKNRELLGTSSGLELPGGAFGSLLQLVEHLTRFGRTLKRGQLVLTGSLLPLYRVAEGDRIEVICEKLGGSVSALISCSKAADPTLRLPN